MPHAVGANIDFPDIDAALTRMGLLAPGERVHYVPLTGGVASDIWRVETPRRTFAVKRALPKLKVEADWFAPVERNVFEVKWMETVQRIVPQAVPEILGHDHAAGLFAMAYLEPARYRNWKNELRAGRTDEEFAAAVGARLSQIHAATANNPVIAAEFATDVTFHAIRLEAYLEATASKHPQVAAQLMALSCNTLATKIALVHGDVSPKNILVGPEGPIFLDAECAWYGDPAFDLAFCLNHMLLKCLGTPRAAKAFLLLFDVLSRHYLEGVTWEPRDLMERRTAQLLPGLFLARIDGKSPVEYITDDNQKNQVRRVALVFLAKPTTTLFELRAAWGREIGCEGDGA